jgi:hypothetical protein
VAKGRIGLDVGSTAVRAAEVTLGGSQPSLVRAAASVYPKLSSTPSRFAIRFSAPRSSASMRR